MQNSMLCIGLRTVIVYPAFEETVKTKEIRCMLWDVGVVVTAHRGGGGGGGGGGCIADTH